MPSGISDIPPALLGAVIGSIGTLLVNLYIEQRREEAKKRRLRQSFRAEFESMDPLENWPDDADISRVPDMSILSTAIYENNCGKLGLLSDPEMEYIIKFYSYLHHTNDLMRQYRAQGDDPESDEMKTLAKLIHSSIDELKRLRSEALELMEDESVGRIDKLPLTLL